MIYRNFGGTGLQVSEIGLGCEHLQGKDSGLVNDVVSAAMDRGINILDCFMSEPNVRSDIGAALKGRRDRMMIQGHLRAVWKNGQYGRTLDIGETKEAFEDLLARLGTDYIDFGMLHMVDNEKDFNAIFSGEILDYALKLKEQGVIRYLGISSHDSQIALRAVKTGIMDCLMLSVNPAYDLMRPGKVTFTPTSDDISGGNISGIDPVRAALYKECETRGVAITTMKTFSAGLLLSSDRSPMGQAMTTYQCISYALSRPAVASAMIGMQTVDEVIEAVGYCESTPSQRDYSSILSLSPSFNPRGNCVYCNHCLPCPAHLDIAQINKYLDLVTDGGQVPPTVQAHYESLDHTASECIGCGSCERSCPFDVKVIARMSEASRVFRK